MQIYNLNPISIFSTKNGKKIKIELGNIKMEMGFCRFAQFRNYINSLSQKINQNTEFVELRLVRKNLIIELSLNDFVKLCHSTEAIISENSIYKN